MTNSLAIYDFDTTQKTAVALFKSGYFTDVKSQEQAIVKILAGQELGLPAFASMAGIHIIQGKPVLGSNIIATLVKNDPRYDYKIKVCDNKSCVIEWFENGKKTGESSFTIDEANNISTKENDKYIKLSEKATWRFYPSDMLFARAISRGARRYAPGIFGGSPVYTPDELGVDTDEEGYVSLTNIVTIEPTRADVKASIKVIDGEFDKLVDEIKAEGGVQEVKGDPEPSHEWEKMDTGEISGRLNNYMKKLKDDPKNEELIKKSAEAKYWLDVKNGKVTKK